MRRVLALFVALVFCAVETFDFASAQSAAATVAGSWAGWMEVSGNFQPMAASLAPDSSPPGAITNLLFGTSRPLQSLDIDGLRVRIILSDPRFPVLNGTLDDKVIAGTAEATGGRTGTFRLIRTAAIETVARKYIGAYRFADGHFLLVDSVPPPLLYSVDVGTGQVRGMYPKSATEFVSGPSILVPDPAQQTLSFEMKGDQITGVVRRGSNGALERASRVEIRQEEVRFRNGDVTLAGTLLTPVSGTRHPAVVFTHGGGAAPREWFWGFGYLMAAHGFAVLAFDKRGSGESTGDWHSATFEELADDAVAGAKFLQSRREVDRRRVGFWGLSQGAWIAPLASVRFGDAAFVITMSGGGLTPARGELLDSEYVMRNAGLSEQDVRDGLAFQQARDEYARSGFGWNEYATLLKEGAGRPWLRLPFTDLSGPATPDDPFWLNYRKFYFYDPLPTLRRLRAPLLAIFGELDTPDGVKANVAAMTAALKDGKHSDFTVRVFPNGRHNLMDLGGFSPNEYPRLQRFVPDLFDTMVLWLQRRVTR